MRRVVKTQYLNVSLIKKEVADFDACLRTEVLEELTAPDAGTEFQLERRTLIDVPFEHLFLVRTKQAGAPRWAKFLNIALAAADQFPVFNRTNQSALLLLKSAGRIFALNFGRTGSLLDRDASERHFGTKVVLNAVDPFEIRSVDYQKLDDLLFKTRRQSAVGEPIGRFGVGFSHTLLNAVMGRPQHTQFASKIVGADNLSLATKVLPTELATKCAEALALYESQEYKKHFPWYDYVGLVTDRKEIDRLDLVLLDRAKSNPASIVLSPPTVVDEREFSHHRLSLFEADSVEADEHAEFVLFANNVELQNLSMSILRNNYVIAVDTEGDEPHQWSVYDSVLFQFDEGLSSFLLMGGQWYRIAATYAGQVRDKLKKVPLATDFGKVVATDRIENDYSKRIAAESGFVCLDRKTPYPSEAESGIELCDLLCLKRRFICVKRGASQSSTLSYLFVQGLGGVRSFMRDRSYREKIKKRIAEKVIEGAPEAFNTLFDVEQPGEKWAVCFVVMEKGKTGGPEQLPFLSQIALSQVVDALDEMRIGYSFCFTG